VRARFGPVGISGRSAALCALAAWLVIVGAAVGGATEGIARVGFTAAVVVAALAGLLLRDWRETTTVSLVAAAVSAWGATATSGELAVVLMPLGIVLTGLLAARARTLPAAAPVNVPAGDRPAEPSAAGVRLPPGVADEALLDRLAIHEMTRARRYERPLTLLLIGVEGWSTMMAERGRRTSLELLSALATRARRVLRDVDAIGVHGDGRLAVLLPETPLEGAQVVAMRIQQAALEDVGLKTRIGAAVFPDDAVTVEALMLEAEAGLDLARLEGISVVQRIRIA
jgi:GGDEF domain-containing protein